MIAAIKESAAGAPFPKNAAGVARVFKQVRQSRHKETDDDDDDSEESDQIKPAPVRGTPPANQRTAAIVEREDPGLYRNIQAVIAASFKDDANNKKKANDRHGNSDRSLSISSGSSASKRRTRRGGRNERMRREKREMKQKTTAAKKPTGENVDNLTCLDNSESTN